MEKAPVVEEFHEQLRELLTKFSTAGYVVNGIHVSWIDLSTHDAKRYMVKSIDVEMSHSET